MGCIPEGCARNTVGTRNSAVHDGMDLEGCVLCCSEAQGKQARVHSERCQRTAEDPHAHSCDRSGGRVVVQ